MTKSAQKKVNYPWRIFATGLSFVLFGIGGPLIGILTTVIVFFLPINAKSRHRFTRRVLQATFKFYVNFMRACGLMTFEYIGFEKLKGKAGVVIANHPSLIDVVFLFAKVENANCVVKQALLKNPVMYPPIKAAGYLTNTDSDLLEKAAHSLNNGIPLIIFPEGTRSVPGNPLHFVRGASNIAIHSKSNILPVLITCDPPALLKNQSWYEIPQKPSHFTLQVLPEISIEQYLAGDDMACTQARRLTRDLENYYAKLLLDPNQTN